MRRCIEPGCGNAGPGTRCPHHQRLRERKRNANPRRRELYTADWAETSRALRIEQPWCGRCGRVDDLTVDHPTLLVWCRSCHSGVEARRRGGTSTPSEARRP